jgi:hypothetical protein
MNIFENHLIDSQKSGEFFANLKISSREKNVFNMSTYLLSWSEKPKKLFIFIFFTVLD